MPVTTRNTFQFLREKEARRRTSHFPAGPFRAGVSLHSHTMFSEEGLDMVPRYTAKLPYLGQAIRRQEAEYSLRKGRPFDFRQAFWTPPLAPRQAYRLEEKQIQLRFQLPALVSLTDHDDLRASLLLRVLGRFQAAPVSIEWTVPFGPTFFHLGIHNLPVHQARELHTQLALFTSDPRPETLPEYLSKLTSFPDLLVVLNHPLWDEKGVGTEVHRESLTALLTEHGPHIHAVELNGLRSWKENADVIALARKMDLPVISGGDRHGREPNAILNLTRAVSFAGFVEEIRYARQSHVVFMPQYREPLKARVLQTMIDVVRDYPENIEGRRLWSDRVFYRDPVSRTNVPLSEIWQDGGPRVVQHFLSVMRFLERRGVQGALRLALEDRSTVWSKAIWSDSEASI